jgi:hypothetical protein
LLLWHQNAFIYEAEWTLKVMAVNHKCLGSVNQQVVDEAVAREARLFLVRAGLTILGGPSTS